MTAVIVRMPHQSDGTIVANASHLLREQGRNDEAIELKTKALPMYRDECKKIYGDYFDDVELGDLLEDFDIELVDYINPTVVYQKDDDSLMDLHRKTVDAILKADLRYFPVVEEINETMEQHGKRYYNDKKLMINYLSLYVDIKVSRMVTPDMITKKPFDEKESIVCLGKKSDGSPCGKRAVWEGYCTRHHPNSSSIPYWAKKKKHSRYDRMNIDYYYLEQLLEAKNEDELKHAFEIYQQNSESEDLHTEMEEWYQNMSGTGLENTMKYEQVEEAMNGIVEYIDSIEVIESLMQDIEIGDLTFKQGIMKISDAISESESIKDMIEFPGMF
jgi:hypothetical protein